MSTTVDLGKITASVTVGTTTTGAAGTNASVSNSGTTQDAVLNFTIPRGAQGVQGPQGSTGPQGPAGPTGPQGPMGDVAVITPEQQAAFTMYSVPGQNTDGPMTQKAVTDNLVAGSISYDNSQSGLASNNMQGAADELSGYLDNTEIVTITDPFNAKYINSDNEWASATSIGERSKNLAVTAGNKYILKAGIRQAIYAFLRSNTSVGNPVDFSSELNHRVSIPAGQSAVITIPSDTTILYLYKGNNDYNFLPEVRRVYPNNQFKNGTKVRDLSIYNDVSNSLTQTEKTESLPTVSAVEGISLKIKDVIDLDSYSTNSKYINSNNAWASGTSKNNRCKLIPVSGGVTYKIASNALHGAIYAFLKSNTTVGNPVDFSSALDHRVVLAKSQSVIVTIPNDTTILYLFAQTNPDAIFLPELTRLYAAGIVEEMIPRYAYEKGVMMGDSITYGVYSYFNNGERWNGVQEGDGISDYIGEFMRCRVDNVGKRGTGYVADTRNINNALEQALVTDYSQYDFCVMMYGVNDYIQGTPLGSIEENLEGTVVGNMSRVFEKIMNDNPYCKILCVGSYNTWGQVSQGGDYISNHPYGDETTDYALGYVRSTFTLRKYLDTQKEVCEHYHVQYFCLADEGIVNLINIKNVLVDGLHPTLELRKYIAQEIAKYLV